MLQAARSLKDLFSGNESSIAYTERIIDDDVPSADVDMNLFVCGLQTMIKHDNIIV